MTLNTICYLISHFQYILSCFRPVYTFWGSEPTILFLYLKQIILF